MVKANTEAISQKLPLPEGIRAFSWNITSAFALIFVHALGLCALHPWFFTWSGFAAMLLGIPCFGFFINICYHRQLAHRSFRTPRWLEHAFVFLALCCLQDTPATWIANHRLHHAKADQRDDPHSPLVSLFWSHCGWLFVRNDHATPLQIFDRWIRDILEDPWYMQMERGYTREWVYLLHSLVFFAFGSLWGWFASSHLDEALRYGASWVIWGVIVRTIVVWHFTWSVNSLSHRFGYRNFATPDNSRNNAFVAWITMGEGWHNNHHADPTCATTQRRWWELDGIYYGICLLERLGLATSVVKRNSVHSTQSTHRPVPSKKSDSRPAESRQADG